MTAGAGGHLDGPPTPLVRAALVVLALLTIVVGVVPPFEPLARRYVWVDALRYGLLASVVPGLLTLGAPWAAGRNGPSARIRALADRRRRHRGPFGAIAALACYGACAVAWRVPPSVDAVERIPELSLLEAASLLAVGVLFWVELVDSPPLSPRASFPVRIGVAAAAMWLMWILAYLLGMAHVPWFVAFRHPARHGLGALADQQIAAGVLWLAAAVVYLPVILVSVIVWLRADEDADDELRKLIRDERRRGPSSG